MTKFQRRKAPLCAIDHDIFHLIKFLLYHSAFYKNMIHNTLIFFNGVSNGFIVQLVDSRTSDGLEDADSSTFT